MKTLTATLALALAACTTATSGVAEQADVVSGGTYIVGQDIPAGTYLTPPVPDDALTGCTWTLENGARDDLVDTGSSDGQQYATVEDGQFWFVSDACRFQLQE